MSDDKNKKGFSGLSSLASKVEDTVAEQAGRKDQAEKPADSQRQGKPQSHPQATVPTPRRAPPRQSDQEVVASGTSRTSTSGSSGVRWFWGFVGVGVLIWLLNVAQEDNSQPSPAPSYTPPASSPRNAPSATSGAQISDLEFSQPPVGNNNVLSVAQIRWCLREDIRIEVLRPLPTSNAQIDQFNAVVADFNSRCGSYRYRQGTLARAQREVERVRARIVASVRPPWQASVSSSGSASQRLSVAPAQPRPVQQRSQLTLDVQHALTALGYQPGPADGFYGARTRSAIQSFRRDVGLAADGQVTQALLERLRREAASRRARGASANTGGVTSPSITARSEGGSSGYFTRNSDQNDVLRLQGTPSDITRYDALGYETWYFGRSTVKIDSRTRRVLEWDNKGNLKVQLLPGNQVTSSSTYTRGSHEDDVLRLQGTPSDITRYDALGYETWYFGRSTVKIDSRTRRVLEWDNKGNLKVQLLPGNQVTSSSTYTRGSHEDDVLRLQGTPSDITRYDALGYETWYFGRSTVKIDSRTRRVLEWDNKGNLKVQLLPGNQVTSSSTYTRGSHEDDVLRLQGTPSDITRYDALGYETWYFGRSTVKIDSRTRRVLEWDNNGNLKVQLLPGNQVTSSSTYTRGSHEDDVLRLQGTPSDITRYDALGYETWYFGRSTVKIDSRTRRVLEWDNKGNLKVQLLPGNQVTSSSTYTRGSHEDDVLRLQGTPSSITRYHALGYETWYFGRSTVNIDSRTWRVMEWDNNGSLKVRL